MIKFRTHILNNQPVKETLNFEKAHEFNHGLLNYPKDLIQIFSIYH